MPPPKDPSDLSRAELEGEVAALRGEVSELELLAAALRDGMARLKGLKPRPVIKPSGMEKATEPPRGGKRGKRRGRGKVTPLAAVEAEVLRVTAPPGSQFKGYEPYHVQFKGYEPYHVQDLVLTARVLRYRRERWLTPEGAAIVAPLPGGIRGHFGPELRRFVPMRYHPGQVTVERLVTRLQAFGVSISKRHVMRLRIDRQDDFLAEDREVLRAGLRSAAWITVDDTGARHRGADAVCTRIGNGSFTWFGTTGSKSRLNFLELPRADHTDHVVNDAALDYMREHALAGPIVRQPAGHPQRHFASAAAWQHHLEQLGITALQVAPDPVRVATEGALWGAIADHGFPHEAVIVSDDAGQFQVGQHALCWIHAERLVHKLETFTDQQRAARQLVRGLIWWFYADLKAYRLAPTSRRRSETRARFERIFPRTTGFVMLDRLLQRLHADKAELLLVLDRPEIPLHTNSSENDIRAQVIRRKISGGTRSEAGRDCRDGFLSLIKTCQKLGLSFWNYLGERLAIPDAPAVPRVPDLVRARCAPA